MRERTNHIAPKGLLQPPSNLIAQSVLQAQYALAGFLDSDPTFSLPNNRNSGYHQQQIESLPEEN